MSALAAAPSAALHPLLEQLVSRHGFTAVDADSIDEFAGAPGHAMLVFTEDPVRYKETLDLAVIAPEVARAFAGQFRVGVLYPEAARKVAPRFGFARWPALVDAARRRLRRSDRRTAQLGRIPRRDSAAVDVGTDAAAFGGYCRQVGRHAGRLWSLNPHLQV